MRLDAAQDLALLEYGVASVVATGEIVSGDLHLVHPIETGALVAAVDGAGHGVEAAIAAQIAMVTLKAYAGQKGVIPLVQHCHMELKGTRGAVMSLATFSRSEDTMTWLGVGNVEGILMRCGEAHEERLLRRPGMVGYRLPPLQAMVTSIAAGDVLIFTTDGIRDDFAGGLGLGLALQDSPLKLAQCIAQDFQKGADDALVLVVRYLGSGK